MKNVIALALSLAIITPAFAQKNNHEDKPKDKKKEAEKKHTLTIGFGIGSGPIIKFQIKVDDKKKNAKMGHGLGAIISAFSDASKPKKMVQKKKDVVPATKVTGTGQTLPSAFYLSDDVQYFPAGSETPLPNARRAHQEYRLQQNTKPQKLMKLNHIILPPMPQVVKPAMATVAAKTAPSCPLCQKTESGNILRVGFAKAPPAGVIVIQTKITETEKTGHKKIIAAPKITTIPGQKATVQTSGPKHGIKLDIVANPAKHHPGHLMVEAVFHKMSKDGTMKLVSKSHMLMKSGKPAKVTVGTKNHKNIEMEIVADHIILNSQLPKPRSIKSSITTATTKSTTGCPHCQKAGNPTIKKFKIVETPKVGVFVIQTKITETDKTGKKSIVAAPKMMTRPGQKASMKLVGAKDGIKLEIVVKPMPHHPGQIMVSPVLHKMDKHGKFKVVAKPVIMTKNGLPAKVTVGTKNHTNIEMEIVANRIFWQPQPHKAMLRMRAPSVVFGATHPLTMPHPPIAWPAPPHFASAMTMSGMTYNTQKNQMCESCKTATMAKCSCCGKSMAASSAMPNIMQAGFAQVTDKTMTVKVYPIKKFFEDGNFDFLDGVVKEDNALAMINQMFDSLKKTIQSSVEPNSWKSAGGEGSIDFTFIGYSFIVRQNEKAHKEIEKLMTDLGKAVYDNNSKDK